MAKEGKVPAVWREQALLGECYLRAKEYLLAGVMDLLFKHLSIPI